MISTTRVLDGITSGSSPTSTAALRIRRRSLQETQLHDQPQDRHHALQTDQPATLPSDQHHPDVCHRERSTRKTSKMVSFLDGRMESSNQILDSPSSSAVTQGTTADQERTHTRPTRKSPVMLTMSSLSSTSTRLTTGARTTETVYTSS